MPFGATERRLRRTLPYRARVNGGSNSDSLKVPLRGDSARDCPTPTGPPRPFLPRIKLLGIGVKVVVTGVKVVVTCPFNLCDGPITALASTAQCQNGPQTEPAAWAHTHGPVPGLSPGVKVVVTCTSPSFREPSSELGPCCSGKSNLGGGSGLLAVRFLRHAVRCH
eukprot:TRINITY_DN22_c0_g1_i9.p1 TRINITY_DN22_c0_g1~~TRINITY_DN22_c0_g1_i9.p1  ORF type:complete len:166 (+),score=2.39 TRINITY_DN22_c0_g1_i9:165-662(+)